MLITFKSHAAPDVTMLDDLATYLLNIIGKTLGERGVIAHGEVNAAIAKLEAAIVVDKNAASQHDALHHHSDEDHHHDMPIGLNQRAFPFLDMLRKAAAENADVLWGV